MKKLYDVVVLRSFAIVMVVAYHAYGLMYWGFVPKMTERFKDLYYVVNEYVVNFRMPLFVFISGYLFSFLEHERGKYPTFMALLKNKFKRLIFPSVEREIRSDLKLVGEDAAIDNFSKNVVYFVNNTVDLLTLLIIASSTSC